MSRSAWTETREPEPTPSGRGRRGVVRPRDVDRPRQPRARRRAPNVRQPVPDAGPRATASASPNGTRCDTVGTFRVVAETDLLRDDRRSERPCANDLLHLVEEGLARPEDRASSTTPRRGSSRSHGREGPPGTASREPRAAETSSTTPGS